MLSHSLQSNCALMIIDGYCHFSSISNSNQWLNGIIFSDVTEVFIKAITQLLGSKFVFDIRHITEHCPCGNGWIFLSSTEKGKYYQSAKICFQSHSLKKVVDTFILDKQASFDLLYHVWILNLIEFLFATSIVPVFF